MIDLKDLPEDWKAPTDREVTAAKKLALSALQHDKLVDYYDQSKNYAGSTFVDLGENAPEDIRPDDLLALNLLSVEVGPHGVRNLLDDNVARKRAIDALVKVNASVTLAEATAKDLVAAWEFHKAVRDAVKNPMAKNPNPWVTTAKLTARKRPHLIPVRDNVVGKALGNAAHKDGTIYWLIFHALLNDSDVQSALATCRERVTNELQEPEYPGRVDDSDIRLLDAALWKYLIDSSRQSKDPQEDADS